jgi:hypothetical protein
VACEGDGSGEDVRKTAALDRLVARLVESAPIRFVVADTDGDRDAAFRLRHEAVVASGWGRPEDLADGREHDEFDASAVHIVGFDGGSAVCTGRLVLPPGPLPTEIACGFVIEPVGHVVDVGRMVVAPSHQRPDHRTFVVLLGRLYLEVRRRGYSVGCGMMTSSVRALARQLGFTLEVLGPDRMHWEAPRAPVRFEAGRQASSLLERWRQDASGAGPSTSAASWPPKPKEVDKP